MPHIHHQAIATSMVIFSAAEAARSEYFGGLWNSETGWTLLDAASTFSTTEAAVVALPVGAPDVRLVTAEQAAKLVLTAKIKDALRGDGFEVARAPAGGWYLADEQDREEVTTGEFASENAAWHDMALARDFVLEEAGLNSVGVFTDEPPNAVLDADEERGAEAPR